MTAVRLASALRLRCWCGCTTFPDGGVVSVGASLDPGAPGEQRRGDRREHSKARVAGRADRATDHAARLWKRRMVDASRGVLTTARELSSHRVQRIPIRPIHGSSKCNIRASRVALASLFASPSSSNRAHSSHESPGRCISTKMACTNYPKPLILPTSQKPNGQRLTLAISHS